MSDPERSFTAEIIFKASRLPPPGGGGLRGSPVLRGRQEVSSATGRYRGCCSTSTFWPSTLGVALGKRFVTLMNYRRRRRRRSLPFIRPAATVSIYLHVLHADRLANILMLWVETR